MNRKWISVLVSLAIGVVCYLSLQPPVRAGSSLTAPVFAPLVPGNLMIYRVGNGSAALTNVATEVFVDEYTTSGTFVQSIPMPTTVNGSQRRLTASGTATSEGFLTLSSDQQYVLLTGYDAALGTTNLVASTASANNRVVGRIDTSGNVDTSTALSDFASNSNPRSAASTNGTDLWITGGLGGVRYTTIGSTASTRLTAGAVLENGRQLKIGRGQLYVTTGAGTTVRMGTVGTGLPTTSGQTVTSLPGLPTDTGSPNSFYLADLDSGVAGFDTVYVADDAAPGTIQKYSLVAGNWTANGTVTVAGARGLTGVHTGSTVTLYATSTSTLSRLIDTSGYNATITGVPTALATAGANTAFRGVAFAPGTSPTAVQLTNLSARPTESMAVIPLTVLALVSLVSFWLILRRRSRSA